MSCKSGDPYLDLVVNTWLKHDKVIILFFNWKYIFNGGSVGLFSKIIVPVANVTYKFRFIIV